MVAIVISVLCILGGIAAVGLLIFGPRPATETRRRARQQRHVEDDIVPLIGLGIIGIDLIEEDSSIDQGDEFSELVEGWDNDDEWLGG